MSDTVLSRAKLYPEVANATVAIMLINICVCIGEAYFISRSLRKNRDKRQSYGFSKQSASVYTSITND